METTIIGARFYATVDFGGTVKKTTVTVLDKVSATTLMSPTIPVTKYLVQDIGEDSTTKNKTQTVLPDSLIEAL